MIMWITTIKIRLEFSLQRERINSVALKTANPAGSIRLTPCLSRIFPLILVDAAFNKTPGRSNSADAILATPKAPCRKDGITTFNEKLISIAIKTMATPRVNFILENGLKFNKGSFKWPCLITKMARMIIPATRQINPVVSCDITILIPYKKAASPAVERTTEKISRCGLDSGATSSTKMAPQMIPMTSKMSNSTKTLFQ